MDKPHEASVAHVVKATENNDEDFEEWIRNALTMDQITNKKSSNSTSCSVNGGRYFCRALLQPRRETCQFQLQRLKALLDYSSVQSGNLAGFCLVPWTRNINDSNEGEKDDTSNPFLGEFPDHDPHQEDITRQQGDNQIIFSSTSSNMDGFVSRVFCMGFWRNMDVFDRFMNDLNSMDYIECSHLECFPKLTFWESFHDIKPSSKMHHWTKVAHMLSCTNTPSHEQVAYQCNERRDNSNGVALSRKRQKINHGNASSTPSNTSNATVEPYAQAASYDPAQIVVAMTSFNIRECSSEVEKQRLLDTMRMLLCKEADYCRRAQSRNEAFGNITYDLFTASEDTRLEEASQDFLIFEEWSNRDSFDQYRSSSHYVKFASAVSKYFLTRNCSSETQTEEEEEDRTYLQSEVLTYHPLFVGPNVF